MAWLRFRTFPHSADLGVFFYGRDQVELWASSGLVLGELVYGKKLVKGELRRFEARVRGVDLTDLFVNWMGELLYLAQVRRVRACLVERLVFEGGTALSATIQGIEVPEEIFMPCLDIKAVTYHQAQVRRLGSGRWRARLVFDL